MNDKQKIRYAMVGLGWFVQDAALPAFANAENSEIVALVSGDQVKLTELVTMYDVQDTYAYEECDDLLNSRKIDAPPSLNYAPVHTQILNIYVD